MPKAEVIEGLRQARAALLSSIEGLTADQMFQMGVVGVWSIKDVLAHLVSWEAELVTTLSQLEQQKKGVPRIVEIEDIDDWNAEQYSLNASRPFETVLEDFHGVHKHLIRVVESLDARTLDDNRVFSWMEGEPLSYLILENATWHEEEHAGEIRQWREAQGF
ncbi:MAG: DinB family protein [Chloroflexi bacterium]|nr:DinB family protein [Chloroflexota bacterium]